MRLINLIPLQEIDFPSQGAFDRYNKQHKLRPDTKVVVAGRVTTAGRASQNSPTSAKGTSVFGGNTKPKEEPKKQGFLSKMANIFGGHKDTEPIKLDPKNPLNNKSVFDAKRGASIKVGTALQNPEKYKHLMPDIQKMIDKDPTGEKFASKIANDKRLAAKHKADHDRIVKSASARGGEKPSDDTSTNQTQNKNNKSFSPIDTLNKMGGDDDRFKNLTTKQLATLSSFDDDSDDNDDDRFGGGSSGGAGASGDW